MSSPDQQLSTQRAAGALGVSALITDNGDFSTDGDIGASQPGVGLVARRQRWNGLAQKHATKGLNAKVAQKIQMMSHLTITACCLRAWLGSVGLLERAWAGPPTKSGCDKATVYKLVPFTVPRGEPPKKVSLKALTHALLSMKIRL